MNIKQKQKARLQSKQKAVNKLGLLLPAVWKAEAGDWKIQCKFRVILRNVANCLKAGDRESKQLGIGPSKARRV